MVKPRVLVLDLDGTTLDAHRRLTPRDVAAAHALKHAGVAVTIATGRLFTGTRWVAQALGVEGSVAVMNGSEVVDVASAVSVVGHYFEAGVRETLWDTLRQCGLSTFLFGSRTIHYDAEDAHHTDLLSIWTEELQVHGRLFEADAWQADDLLAVGVAGDEPQIRELRDLLATRLPADVEGVVFSPGAGQAFLKIRHGQIDKGTALHKLAADRGTTVEACVAVGDWWNDVPMLKTAGRSFAMAHAADQVKATAHEVLESSREGGTIAEIARKVWGISA